MSNFPFTNQVQLDAEQFKQKIANVNFRGAGYFYTGPQAGGALNLVLQTGYTDNKEEILHLNTSSYFRRQEVLEIIMFLLKALGDMQE